MLKMLQRIKKLTNNTLLKNLYVCIKSFWLEYVTNHVVNGIPNLKFRLFYYKFVLRNDINFTAYIYMNVYWYCSPGEKIRFGNNVNINRRCIIDGRGGLSIGHNVNISAEAAIYTAGHIIDDKDFSYYTKPVCIGDRVWIGTRAMIMPGVTIGEGAVVLPGSVVVKDVKPYEVVGGIPARHIADRSEDLSYDLDWRGMFL